MIYVLYGQPASGKTTIGKKMAEFLQTPFVIDGDEFREMFSNANYGKDGREQNIRNANAVATYLNKKGARGDWSAIYCRDKSGNNIKGLTLKEDTDVIMCLVNPYEKLREELKENNQDEVVEIYLQSDRELRKEYHVKDFEVGNPELIINTDKEPESTWQFIKAILFIDDNDYLG
jgi:adenylylsulfate kinase-like enzyme